MERLERGGLIVRGAILPTARAEADPCEGEGPYGRLVRLALVALLLGIDLGPEGMPRGFRRPCHERGPEERRTPEAPVAPGLLATAFRDWRDARLFVVILGRDVALPLCAAGHEEAGRKDGPGTGQSVKQGEVRMALGTRCDSGVKVGDGLQGDAEWGDEGLPQEGVGGDDTCIGGQRHSTLDGLDACRDDIGGAHVVGPEAVLQGGATRELCGFEGVPAAEDVAKDHRLFLLKPLQDMREGVLQRTGQAMRETDCVADQATAVFDELFQGPHSGAWGGERGARVTVFEEKRNLEFGIGGVVCGPARGQCVAVPGQGERIDGKKHEEILWAQCGHTGPCMQRKAHSDEWSVEPRAQGVDPRLDRFRAVREDQQLASC